MGHGNPPWHHSPRWVPTKPLTNNDRAWLHLRQRRWRSGTLPFFPSCHLLVQQKSSLLLQGCRNMWYFRFLFFAAQNFPKRNIDCPRPSHCQLLAHSAMSPPQTEAVNFQINHVSNCECLCHLCLCPNIQILKKTLVLFQSVFPRSQAYSIRN